MPVNHINLEAINHLLHHRSPRASIRVACSPEGCPRSPFGGDPGAWRKANSPKVRQSFPGRGFILTVLPEPQVYRFSNHICTLCATRGTDVFRLGTKLGIDPMELLQMINGKTVPTRAVISALAKELDSNVSLLTKLAAEIKP
jgi:hypothetical protein